MIQGVLRGMTQGAVQGRQVLLVAVVVAAAAIAFAAPGGLAQDQAVILGVIMVTLALWSTGLAPAYLASLFLFAALLVPGLAEPSIVLSGFSSAAMWLVMSGFVIGAAIRSSGLGDRFGALAAPRLARSYTALIAGFVLLGAGLGFLMPSSIGRAMVLAPLAMALAESLGLHKGSKGRTGVALAVALSSSLPSFAILPANIPNMALAGASESVLGITIGYTDYVLLHYPVLGLLKSLLIIWLILRFFPAEAPLEARTGALAAAPDRPNAKASLPLVVILFVTLGFWATDWLHGVQPAWVAMTAAIVLMLPWVGYVSPEEFRSSVDFGTLLLVAGVLALGAVVNDAGLGPRIAALVTQLLPLAPGQEIGQEFGNFVSLSALAVLTSLLTTMPGVPAVLTPLAPDLAAATGLSVEAVLMTQVIGFSTVLFPYQAAPLIIAMGLAGEPVRPLFRITLVVALLSLFVLTPLDFLWWRALGWI